MTIVPPNAHENDHFQPADWAACPHWCDPALCSGLETDGPFQLVTHQRIVFSPWWNEGLARVSVTAYADGDTQSHVALFGDALSDCEYLSPSLALAVTNALHTANQMLAATLPPQEADHTATHAGRATAIHTGD